MMVGPSALPPDHAPAELAEPPAFNRCLDTAPSRRPASPRGTQSAPVCMAQSPVADPASASPFSPMDPQTLGSPLHLTVSSTAHTRPLFSIYCCLAGPHRPSGWASPKPGASRDESSI